MLQQISNFYADYKNVSFLMTKMHNEKVKFLKSEYNFNLLSSVSQKNSGNLKQKFGGTAQNIKNSKCNNCPYKCRFLIHMWKSTPLHIDKLTPSPPPLFVPLPNLIPTLPYTLTGGCLRFIQMRNVTFTKIKFLFFSRLKRNCVTR